MNKLDKGINKLVKLVASISVLGFSVLSLVAAALAWFASNNNVSNSGMNISAERMDGKLRKVYFYGFNGYEDDSYLFYNTPLATYTYNWATHQMDPGIFTGDPNWEVPMYDSMSKYQSLLMVFEYDKEYTCVEDGEFGIRGVTDVGGDNLETAYTPEDTDHTNPFTVGGGYIGARLDNGSPYFNLSEITNPSSGSPVFHSEDPESILMKQEVRGETRTDFFAFSSVARFQHKLLTSSEYETFTSGEKLSISADSLTESKTFTSINNDTDHYFFNQRPSIYESKINDTFQYVAVVVGYSADAIGYIYSTYLGDDYMNEIDSTIYFACDWGLEIY